MRRPPTVLVVIGIVVAAGLLSRPVRRVTWTVLRTPLVVIEGFFRTLAWLPQLPALTEEHAVLRSELAAHQLELVRLRETLRHVTSAQQLLHAAPGARGTVVSIIGRSVIPTEHTIILDRGSQHGLKVDHILFEAAGVVGRLIEVHPSTSIGMLITDPNSRVSCLIERSRESGLLVGTGESLAQVVYLDAEADVVVGDAVVTAGLGGLFPKGLALGTVVTVERDEPRALTRLWVRPAVRLNQLEEMLCLPPASSS